MTTDNTQAERWLPTVGFEGHYEVSSHGRVKSLDRQLTNRVYPGKVLKPSLDKQTGYLGVSLSLNGKRHNRRVHRLVAEAFIDEVNGKPHVNHIDGDKLNNSAENLEWVTIYENIRHAIDVTGHKPDYKRLSSIFEGKSSKKTHCKRGHKFTPGNTIQRKNKYFTGKLCRTCKNKFRRSYMGRKEEA